MLAKIPKFITVPALLLILLFVSYVLSNIGSGKTSFENFFLGSQNLFKESTPQEDPVDQLLENSAKNFDGNYAIYIKNLKTGNLSEVNPDEKFTSASLYKLAVMYKAYDSLAKNEIKMDEVLSGQSADLDKTLAGVQNDTEPKGQTQDNFETTSQTIAYSINEALRLMITISDNYAALLLAQKLGWQNIDQLMEKEGFLGIDLIGPDDPTVTARALGNLLEKIYRNQAVNPQSSSEMEQLLFDQKINDRIPKYLPQDIKVGHKTGELDGIRHDAGIVLGKKSHYIFVFLTDSLQPLDAAEKIAILSKQIFDLLEQNK